MLQLLLQPLIQKVQQWLFGLLALLLLLVALGLLVVNHHSVAVMLWADFGYVMPLYAVLGLGLALGLGVSFFALRSKYQGQLEAQRRAKRVAATQSVAQEIQGDKMKALESKVASLEQALEKALVRAKRPPS